MKLSSAILLVAASTVAAKYEAGQICHTNTECNDNCAAQTWTIANQDGGPVFVCDEQTTASTATYALKCLDEQGQFDARMTSDACESLTQADSYPGGCAYTTSRSEDESLRTRWKQECQELGVEITVESNETEGRKAAQC